MLAKYITLWSMMRNERRPLGALHALQEAKLRRLIGHAYEHVPFYRRMFAERGLTPNDIQTIEDLRKLPVIDKSDLKAQRPGDLLSDRYPSAAELIRISTSGSSGTPFDFFIDERCDRLRKAQYLRPYLSNGLRLTDSCVHFTAFPGKRPTWFQRLGFLTENRIACDAPHEAQLEALNAVRPEVIVGYPSALASLAALILDQGIDVPTPRVLFSDSELLTPHWRSLIERGFRAPLIDVFGSFETDNIAYECERHRGYHVAIDCVVLELVTEQGRPVLLGEEGEMVCTVLDNLAMPFIRYNLHDVAAYSTSPCECGRTLPLLKIIAGRSDDMVRLPDGSTQSPQMFLQPFKGFEKAVKEHQIIQEAVNRFRIIVVPAAAYDETAGERLRSFVTSRYPSAQVILTVVDRIPREPSGKRRAFLSQVSDDHGG